MWKGNPAWPWIKNFFLFITYLAASWFLVHAFALMGVFVAAAFPIWWIFAPKLTVCFLCRAQADGSMCPFCRQKINKNEGLTPKTLASALANSMIMLVFSLLSLGVVFTENQVLQRTGLYPVTKTASFVIPSKGQYRLGEIFPIKIEITNNENPINAVQADIGFNPQRLEIQDISTKDSFANVFIQKEINNEAGYARLTGGLPNPGFLENYGVFGTVFFKSKSPGLVKIEFLPTSMVLANDGRGSNILKDLPTMSYLILPDEVSPEEAEEQKKLIRDDNVLGESTATQLVFFEDKPPVLGTTVDLTKKPIQSGKPTNMFMEGIKRIDRTILNFWRGSGWGRNRMME